MRNFGKDHVDICRPWSNLYVVICGAQTFYSAPNGYICGVKRVVKHSEYAYGFMKAKLMCMACAITKSEGLFFMPCIHACFCKRKLLQEAKWKERGISIVEYRQVSEVDVWRHFWITTLHVDKLLTFIFLFKEYIKLSLNNLSLNHVAFVHKSISIFVACF
jgi:hypothetical protein